MVESSSWEILKSELVFNNKWFKVRKDIVKLPDDRIVDDYFMWQSGDVVLIVPVTADGEFVLVKQYKHAAKKEVIEFPAGIKEENESALESARRELLEETGYSSDRITLISELYDNPTKQTGILNIFLAQNVIKTNNPKFDENEQIETIIVSSNQLLAMVSSGEICVSGSVAAAFLALNKLDLLE